MVEQTARLAQQLDTRSPGQVFVTLDCTDDLFLDSFNWARVQRGIPLPEE
jgi:hypothetical protein